MISLKPKPQTEEPPRRLKKPTTGLIDLAITGLDPDALPDLAAYKEVSADSATDHVVVHPGDIWLLGDHRLICGDSTDASVVARLLNGERPHLCVTDQPYGVAYDANWRNEALRADGSGSVDRAVGIVSNDTRTDWREVWALFPGDVIYLWHASLHAPAAYESLQSVGFDIRYQIIWAKSRFVISQGHYHWQHEPCLYAVRKGKTGHWQGSRSQTSVWNIEHLKSDSGHSTQKPIECMKRPIENNSQPGDAVYEPFCGSGTTIIAAEMTQRRCYAIELNPLYVYVAINRWQMFTGKLARLEEAGETFSEVLLRRSKEPRYLEPVEREEMERATLDAHAEFDKLLEVPTATPSPPLIKPSVTIATPPARRFTVEPPKRAAWVDPFLAAHADVLRAAGNNRIRFDEDTWENAKDAAVGCDVEVYRNFFVVCFKRFSDGKRIAFEMSDRTPLDRDGLRTVLHNNLIVTFNGSSYDLPIIYLALKAATNSELKDASDRIVKGELRPWQVEKELGVAVPDDRKVLDHIDLFEPNPSIRDSLKRLGARLHTRFITDLPVAPDATLTHEQMNHLILYCGVSDLDATHAVWDAMQEPIELRRTLSNEYKIDLRSKSDAQIGEAIVKHRVEQITKSRIDRGVAPAGSFGYNVPDFIRFEGADLNALLNELRTAQFTLNAAGKIVTPEVLTNREVTIGEMTYAIGIGGLHSQESHRALKSDDKRQLVDIDVASQYPAIIMKLGLYPKAMGPAFLDVYSTIIQERLAAKAVGDKAKADGGKIAANGVYGKFGSPYSPLYAPHLVIATTLTGQLSLLTLIERAELAGIPVVSANTDGVVFHCPRELIGSLNDILIHWEDDTGFTIEKNYYEAIYSSSVNSYIALYEGGKVKRKGPIANPLAENDLRGLMSKNPQMYVISDAALAYVRDGTPVEETIRACRDPRAFITVIKVNGGGLWRGNPLGRVVRYYWSTDGDPIMYADGSRKVSKTDGARPLCELTDVLPIDIDIQRYIMEANKLLQDIGAGATLI